MQPAVRPPGLRLLAVGWILTAAAALVFAAGAGLLVPWAWFSLADASAADRTAALRELTLAFASLVAFAALAVLTAVGLWRLNRWGWWLAAGLQLGLIAFLSVRLLATGAPGFIAPIVLLLIASGHLARSATGIRPWRKGTERGPHRGPDCRP